MEDKNKITGRGILNGFLGISILGIVFFALMFLQSNSYAIPENKVPATRSNTNTMYIVLLTYKKPLEEIDKYGSGHVAFLDKYFNAKKFLVSGRQNPRTGGVIIVYNVTREELEGILEEDPFKQHDMADYTITEFTPVKYQELFKSFITE